MKVDKKRSEKQLREMKIAMMADLSKYSKHEASDNDVFFAQKQMVKWQANN
jgi:hypothetical protein